MKLIHRFLVLLALTWIGSPALADINGRHEAMHDPIRLAQLSAEQRERLRERWEETSPEERAAIRRELRERINDIPPEQREQVRKRLIERMQTTPRLEREEMQNRWQEDAPHGGNGFGQGFEHRRDRMEGPGSSGRGAPRGRQR